jgi:2'-5' RNA ligase
MQLGIAILPSAMCRSRIIEAQRNLLSQIKIEPELNHSYNHPHVTLVQGRFSAVDPVVSAAKAVAEVITRFDSQLSLVFTKIEYQERGWLFASIERSSELRLLHDVAFARCAPFLIVAEDDLAKDVWNYTQLERLNFKRFGYRYIGEAFYPHITLGKDRTMTPEALKAIGEQHFRSTLGIHDAAEAVTVYEMGAHGSHHRILEQIDIG